MSTKKTASEIARTLISGRLVIHAWGANVKSDPLSEELERNHTTAKGTIRATVKQLVDEYRLPIVKASGDLREKWFTLTLPLEDGGKRVAKSERYCDINDALRPLVAKYNEAAEQFFLNYDDAKEKTRAETNGLFDEARFIAKEDIFARYHVDLQWYPVNVDVHIEGLAEEHLERIRRDTEQAVTRQVERAVRSIAGNIGTLAVDLVGRIESEKERTKFNRLIARAREVIEASKSLNLTGDPAINEVIEEAERLFLPLTHHSVKHLPHVRAQALSKGHDLIAKINALDL